MSFYNYLSLVGCRRETIVYDHVGDIELLAIQVVLWWWLSQHEEQNCKWTDMNRNMLRFTLVNFIPEWFCLSDIGLLRLSRKEKKPLNGCSSVVVLALLIWNAWVHMSTGYASQHIWCLSQAMINWEACARKGIRHKNGGDSRDECTN